MNRGDVQSVRPIPEASLDHSPAPRSLTPRSLTSPVSSRNVTPRPSEMLSNAHERALQLCESALVALRTGNISHATTLWGTAEMQLVNQLDSAERLILPMFRFVDPLAAHGVLRCHRRLRELCAACSRHFDSLAPHASEAEEAIHALRSHDMSETTSMSQWADRKLAASTRKLLWGSLVSA